MGSEFTFYDYVDADGSGENVINAWLNTIPKKAKARLNRQIGWLEASKPAGFDGSVWRDSYVWPLHEGWKDFIEIRAEIEGIQYRIIAKVEDRTVFLVGWGYHKGQWETSITPQTAKERVDSMKNAPGKYRREHDNR